MADYAEYIPKIIDPNVLRILEEGAEPLVPYKIVDGEQTERWNTQMMNAITLQSIQHGDGAWTLARNLANGLGMSNFSDAMRNARTALNSSESRGQFQSMRDARQQGIKLKKQWIAFLDNVTRESHADLNEEIQDLEKPFDNGLMYPGDLGPPEEVYNCRCTMDEVFEGIDYEVNEVGSRSTVDLDYGESVAKYDDELKQMESEIGRRPMRSDFVGDIEYGTPEYWEAYERHAEALEEWKKEEAVYNEKKGVADNAFNEWFNKNYGGRTVTDEELAKWAESRGVQIRNIEGLDRSALVAYMDRYDKLISDFPIVRRWYDAYNDGNRFGIEFTGARDYLAEAHGGINFGEAFADYRQATEVVRNGMLSGDSVGGNPAVHVFDHEFGHQLESALNTRHLWENGIFDVGDAPRSTREELDLRDQRANELRALWQLDGHSDYSTTDLRECFAEGFAAWYGGQQTQFAIGFGDFFQRWYS